MNRKFMTKSIAALLAFILTFANVILLGIYTQESIATSTNLEEQSTEVSNASIEFDAYFKEGEQSKHSKDIDLALNSDNLNLDVRVTEGYLANGSIKLENSNFKFADAEGELQSVQSINTETDIVTLNQINKNESVTLELPIKMKTDSDFDVQNVNRETDVILEGTYVNNSGTETNISKTIKVNAKMTAEATAELDMQVLTYVPYEIGTESGLVVQYLVKSNIKDDVLPIEKTELEIEIPEINNVEATSVSVSARGTKATNGEEEKVFVLDEDYTYEEGKVKLTINNTADANGKTSWEKEAQDEIIITTKYAEGAIAENNQITSQVASKITLYSINETPVQAEKTLNETMNEKVGEIVTYDVTTNKETLSKGYMLIEGTENTEYVENMIANISNKELIDSIILDSEEKYVDEDDSKHDANILYTYTKISEENFLNILGESGYIKIYNNEGQLIATIDKDNLQYNYQTETTYIKVETSKPDAEGILKIENGREIKPLEYSKDQTASFKQIEEKINGKTKYQETDLFEANKTKAIELTNPETTIEVTINPISLSTTEKNTSVEIRTVLDTSDSTKALYKNPKITIEFPTYINKVENVNISEPLYGQGLTLRNHEVKTNANENKVIEITLNGEQTAFNTSSVSNGAIVDVFADITVDEIAPAIKENVKVTVTNENALSTEDEENVEISYAAEKDILVRNAIANYNEHGLTSSTTKNVKLIHIQPEAEARNIIVKIDAVNSLGKEISNVSILGRIPFEGNKKVNSNNDLTSTFTTNMTSQIRAGEGTDINDFDVYYSENGNATKDLTDEQNGWTKTPSDLTLVRSYLIVSKAENIENGAKASFEYDAQIPANLEADQKTYSTFAVYYKKGTEEKVKEAPEIGLVTNRVQEPETIVSNDELEANITISTSGNTLTAEDTVKEGQYIDYEVKIKNKTANSKTLDLEVAKENGTFYGLVLFSYTSFGDEPLYMYDELEDETLSKTIEIEPNSIYTYKYTVVVNKDAAGQNLTTAVSFKQNDAKVLDDLEIVNPIQDALIKLTTKYNNAEESLTYSRNSYSAFVEVTNISGRDLSNVRVEVELPEILSYYPFEMFESQSDFDSKEVNGNTLKYTINQIRPGEVAVIYIPAIVDNIDLTKEYEELRLYAIATVEEETYTSNSATNKIMQSETLITGKVTGSVQGEYVEDGDEIIYTIEIENKGILEENYLNIEEILPEALRVRGYCIIYNDGSEKETYTSYNKIQIDRIQIQPGSKIILKIATIVDEKLAKDDIITNSAKLSGACFETFSTNTVTYKLRRTVNPDDPSNPDNPSDNEYKISGLAWYDANFNGKRDSNEKLLSGIKVMLMNNKDSEFVKDSNGQEIYALTKEDGTYAFEGLESGEYVVVFLYDINTYKVAIYQATDVNADKNSDVIDTEIRINGVDTKVATSDIVSIGESNRENIDLGLIDLYEFDMKVEKEIKTVIVQNKQGTKSYTFEDGKAAKVEIPSKYMVGTTLTIEYKISVTNEGDVSGRILKLADYMPKDLEFSSEINLEWYQGTDGNLYTQELENTEIKPGETKEITLVLTKVLKEEAAEIINNVAEITDTYNTQGKLDRDSTPGNNAQDEDDLSYADLIVTIKTGAGTYMLITLGIIILVGIFAGGIYLIKKKVLTEEI